MLFRTHIGSWRGSASSFPSSWTWCSNLVTHKQVFVIIKTFRDTLTAGLRVCSRRSCSVGLQARKRRPWNRRPEPFHIQLLACKTIHAHVPNFISFKTRTNACAAEAEENKSSISRSYFSLFADLMNRIVVIRSSSQQWVCHESFCWARSHASFKTTTNACAAESEENKSSNSRSYFLCLQTYWIGSSKSDSQASSECVTKVFVQHEVLRPV